MRRWIRQMTAVMLILAAAVFLLYGVMPESTNKTVNVAAHAGQPDRMTGNGSHTQSQRYEASLPESESSVLFTRQAGNQEMHGQMLICFYTCIICVFRIFQTGLFFMYLQSCLCFLARYLCDLYSQLEKDGKKRVCAYLQ